MLAHRIGSRRGQIRAAAVELLVAGQELGPVAFERGEEVLARARAAGRGGSPRSRSLPRRAPRARPRRAAPACRSEPGSIGAIPTPASIAGVDELLQRAQPLARRSGARLGAAPDLVVERRDGERHRHLGTASPPRPAASTSRTISGPRVMIENGLAASRERLDAGARQPVATLGRLVRIGRRADRDGLPLPATARASSRRSTCGDVRLHADARAVAVVPRPVGARLEGADVTERALVAQPMYGLSDQANGIPRTRLRAFRHGSSRYSTRIPGEHSERMFVGSGRRRSRPYTPARELDEQPS